VHRFEGNEVRPELERIAHIGARSRLQRRPSCAPAFNAVARNTHTHTLPSRDTAPIAVSVAVSWAAKFEGTESGDATRAAATAIVESLNAPMPRADGKAAEDTHFVGQ
jgi:hypothetical protein